jgi:hypothetical protein
VVAKVHVLTAELYRTGLYTSNKVKGSLSLPGFGPQYSLLPDELKISIFELFSSQAFFRATRGYDDKSLIAPTSWLVYMYRVGVSCDRSTTSGKFLVGASRSRCLLEILWACLASE